MLFLQYHSWTSLILWIFSLLVWNAHRFDMKELECVNKHQLYKSLWYSTLRYRFIILYIMKIFTWYLRYLVLGNVFIYDINHLLIAAYIRTSIPYLIVYPKMKILTMSFQTGMTFSAQLQTSLISIALTLNH